MKSALNFFVRKRVSVLAFAALTAGAQARDNGTEIPMDQTPAASLWSISTGIGVSSIHTRFSIDRATSFPNLPALSSGSTQLYTGGSSPVVYEDGVVGIGGPNNPNAGTTGFSGGTLTPNYRVTSYNLFTATFHGGSSYVFFGAKESNADLSAQPYIKLSRLVANYDSASSVSLFGQYSFSTVSNSKTLYPAAYKHGHALSYDSPAGQEVVYDAAAINSFVSVSDGPYAINPRDKIENVFVSYGGVTRSHVNVDSHTFVLGADFTKDVGSRVHLILSAGAIVNFFDYDFTTQSVVGSSSFPSYSKSGQEIRFGGIVQAGVNIDLDSKKRYFAEISTNYHLVDKLDVSAPTGSVSIDASSWGVNFGIGHRF
jgi:hypothetical protein